MPRAAPWAPGILSLRKRSLTASTENGQIILEGGKGTADTRDSTDDCGLMSRGETVSPESCTQGNRPSRVFQAEGSGACRVPQKVPRGPWQAESARSSPGPGRQSQTAPRDSKPFIERPGRQAVGHRRGRGEPLTAPALGRPTRAQCVLTASLPAGSQNPANPARCPLLDRSQPSEDSAGSPHGCLHIPRQEL